MEVAGETSETRITYALPNGSYKTEIATGPVRTRQNDAWVPIDTTLIAQGGRLKPKAVSGGVTLEVSSGGSDAFVKISADGRSYALRWPTPLPKPTVKGSVATYTDAGGIGADLVVTALPTGFRHDVVLRRRPAKPLELRIGVEDGGLTLAEGKGGQLLLKDKGNKIVSMVPQPIMWDGSAKGRLPLAKRAKVAADVVTNGGRSELVLKPDHAFLTDPSTTYPVRVDPTVTLPLDSDVEVTTYDTVDLPAYPDNTYLMAGTMTGGFKSRVHLRFDTANLQGSTVTDARLSMNTIDAQNCGPTVGNGVQVARLTGAWNPDNLYWANKPAFTTEDASSNTKGVTSDCDVWPDSMEWNVTGIAQDWAAGAADHGLVLKSPGEANVDNYRTFTASEDTDFNIPPKLTITTSGSSSAPTISGLTITPAQTVGGTMVTSSLTPQLAATVADVIGGNLTGEFEIEHDPAATSQGTGQIWVGASPAVTSSSQATVSVPAGKLTDGWKIRWRARAVNAAAATSSTWSNWLAVTVDMPDPNGQPTVSTLQVDPSQQVNGQTMTGSLTPALLAQVTDPTGQPLRVEYAVEHDPAATGQGTGQIWAGALDNAASGSQAKVTVPEGSLQDGWKVRWRARALNTTTGVGSEWSAWQGFQIAVELVGDALAHTARAVIPTDASFAVAAWLRWENKDGAYTIVEQKGLHQAPFHLGNTPGHGLVFTFTSADSSEATTEGVRSQVEPPVNEWFHLTGVYDATLKKATLYLNGAEIKSETIGFPAWRATGLTTLGTQMSGALDDIHVYDKALTAQEAAVIAGATTVPAVPSATKPSATEAKRATAAVVDPVYHRIEPEDCIRENSSFYYPPTSRVPARNEKGWTQGPHDWCVSQKPKFTVEIRTRLGWQVTDEADFVLMTIGRTFNDSRTAELDVIALSMNDQVKGAAFKDQVFSLGLIVQPSPSGSCRQVVDANYPQGFAGNRHYWNSSRRVTFKIESPETGWQGGGDALLSECNVQLSLTAPHMPGLMYKNRTAKGLIRCDSAKENRYFPRGCIFDHKMRALELKEVTFPNAYAHISKAYLTPNITTPSTSTTDRRMWPKHMNFGEAKKFPGFSTVTPLTRLKDGKRRGRNYYRSFRICAADFDNNNPSITWNGGSAPWNTGQKECDEFPFQSTYQGSWVSWQENKPNDKGKPYMSEVTVSVSLIPKQENTDWGAMYNIAGLGRFYMNDRILHGEDFILHLYNANGERIN